MLLIDSGSLESTVILFHLLNNILERVQFLLQHWK